MYIKMIDGAYGYNNGVTVKPMTPADAPFSVSDEEARRLAALGVAEIVSEGGILPANDDGTNVPVNVSEIEGEPEIPRYSDFSTKSELQAIAKKYGVEVSERATKSEMIKALDDYFADMPEISMLDI